MRRSEIKQIMRESVAFLSERRVALPPFAYSGPDEWQIKGEYVASVTCRS